MHCFVVFCLLSAAVALPTSEQLRINLPALPSSPELKSKDTDNISDDQVLVDAIPPIMDARESEEAKNPSESAETPKAEKDEDKDKLPDVITVIQKESKESMETKDSNESKGFEERPEQPKEEKKDSKYEESKEGDEDDGPIIVQVLQKPSQKDLMPIIYNNKFELPWPIKIFSDLFSKLWNRGQRNQPMYIVRETDFAYDDRN